MNGEFSPRPSVIGGDVHFVLPLRASVVGGGTAPDASAAGAPGLGRLQAELRPVRQDPRIATHNNVSGLDLEPGAERGTVTLALQQVWQAAQNALACC